MHRLALAIVCLSACVPVPGPGLPGAPDSPSALACERYFDNYVACEEEAGNDVSGFTADTICPATLIYGAEIFDCLATAYDRDCTVEGAIDEAEDAADLCTANE